MGIWREIERVIETTPEDAHHYLKLVYQGLITPDSARIKAAQIALEYEKPKLSTTAVLIDGGSFAERLQRSIERTQKVLGPKVIEAEAIEIEAEAKT